MVACGRGDRLDVSSGFAAVNAPGLVPYAASKAGLSHFHAGVRGELCGTGVGDDAPATVKNRVADGTSFMAGKANLTWKVVPDLVLRPRLALSTSERGRPGTGTASVTAFPFASR